MAEPQYTAKTTNGVGYGMHVGETWWYMDKAIHAVYHASRSCLRINQMMDVT